MQDKCQCEFRIRMLGDGCRYCQPQEYIDRLHDTMEDMVHVYELSDEEIDETVRKNALGHGRLIYMLNKNVLSNDFKQAIRSLARAIETKVRGQ